MSQGPDNESYGEYSVDDEDQPAGDGDSLVDNRGLKDPMEEGYSPPEKWSAAQGYGNTPREEALGETLDQRIRQEDPEPDPYAEDDYDPDEDELDDGEVGSQRAGRLIDRGDGTSHLLSDDAGIDGAGASAEEAAVHVVDDGPRD